MLSIVRVARLAVAFALLALAEPAAAHEIRIGALLIGHPYTFEPETDAVREVEVYMTIRNAAATPDRLIAVSSSLAGQARLQRREPGGAAAVPVTTFDVPALQETTLGPRGVHVRLDGLKVPLGGYAYFPMSLTFETAGTVEIEVMVEENK